MPQQTYPWGGEFIGSNLPPLDRGRATPTSADVDAHATGMSPFGILDMVGNIYQWTDESCDNHTCRGIVRGGNNYYPQGSSWYFPPPGCTPGGGGRGCNPGPDGMRGDLNVFNALLLLSESMDRSGGIGFRCMAEAEPPVACPFQLCGSSPAVPILSFLPYRSRPTVPALPFSPCRSFSAVLAFLCPGLTELWCCASGST